MIFLAFIKKKKYLNNLIFRAKNRDFDQKLDIIEFGQFLARKFKA